MEFWVGLSVGMHLGKVIADYLEKLIEVYGLLDSSTVEKVRKIEVMESKMSSIADRMLD